MSEVIDLAAAFKTKNIVEAIIDWNKARYEPEYNHQLTMDLLDEEFQQELIPALQAQDIVEICDAYADVFYVAVGGIWKLTDKDHTYIQKGMDNVEAQLGPLVPPLIAAITWHDSVKTQDTLSIVALAALKDLSTFLRSEDAALDVIRAVCDSNASKTASKTPSGVKANINKGENYFPPTEKIEKILVQLTKGAYHV